MVILNDIKKLLGIEETDISFDDEIVMYINGAVMVLTQIGVGPQEGFMITKESKWDEFVGERKDLELIKSAIYLRVRLIFDPPSSGFLVDAITKLRDEYEWRINIQVDPSPIVLL